jgi:hypothetical protein
MTRKIPIEEVVGMKVSNREKIFIIATVIVLLGALYYSLFYKGLRQEIKGIRNSIQRDKEKLENVLQSEEKIEDLHRYIGNLEVKAHRVSRDDEGFNIEPKLIVFLENSIKNLGLSTRIGIKDAEEYDKFYFIPVTINFESNYINFRRILDNIEKAPWPYSIDYINTNKRDGSPEDLPNKWDVEMVINFLAFQGVDSP